MTWAAVAAAGIITGGSLIGGALNGGPSAPTPSYGGAGGGQPYFYQPTGQGAADTQLQGMFTNYQNPYTAFAPQFNSYLSAMQNNPYVSGFQNFTGDAAGRFGGAGDAATNAGNNMYNFGGSGVQALQNLIPAAAGGNPYSQYMTQWANTGGQQMGLTGTNALASAAQLPGMASSYAQPLSTFANTGATNLQQLAGTATAGILPYGQQIASTMPTLASSYTSPTNAASSQILNTAFDPQGLLYTQQYQQNLDATRAALAARGLDTSGVGAGIEMQSIQDFNSNWQNNQLGRQIQGLSAAGNTAATNYGIQSGAYGQGLNSLISAATGTFDPYATAYSSGVSGLNTAATTGYGLNSNAATTAEQLGTAGAQDIINGAAAPYNAAQKSITDNVSLLANIGQAGSPYANISGLGGGQLTTGANDIYQMGAMPYNTYNSIQGNNYGALMNVYNPYSQSTQYDNQMMGNLMQYLGQGTSAGQAGFGAGMGAYNAGQTNLSNIGALGGNAAYMFNNSQPYNGGPFAFGNSFGATPYSPLTMPNYYIPSAGYGSGTQLASFTPFTG